MKYIFTKYQAIEHFCCDKILIIDLYVVEHNVAQKPLSYFHTQKVRYACTQAAYSRSIG